MLPPPSEVYLFFEDLPEFIFHFFQLSSLHLIFHFPFGSMQGDHSLPTMKEIA